MTHEFEYKVEWFYEDGTMYARSNFLTDVEDDGTLEEFEAEEIARTRAEEFAELEEPELDHEITLTDAR